MSTELHKELKELGSSLSQVSKTYFADNNQVPNGYFESMEDRFFTQLQSLEQPRVAKSISIFEGKRFSYAVAAVAVFAILGLGFLRLFNEKKQMNLSQIEVKQFLEEEGLITTHTNLSQLDIKQVSKEEAIQFLIEEEGMDFSKN